jgi:SAM-dependent methyltransferase
MGSRPRDHEFTLHSTRLLLCPVRGCHMALAHAERRLFCPRGHSFDVARSGYINLLQPQERRSKQPGDTAAAIAGRRRLHDSGVTQPLLHAIAEIMAASPSDIVLDAGCGEGFYLGTLARQTGFDAHGVDISIPAVDAAARRYPGCEWIVANADRFVPYADRSFSIVMSITARMNTGEFQRVLRDDGRLLVALPAPRGSCRVARRGPRPRGPNRRYIGARLHAGRSAPRRHRGRSGRCRCSRRPAFDLPANAIAAGQGDASDVQSGSAAVSALGGFR